MPRAQKPPLSKLPVTQETWLVMSRRLRVFIEDDEGALVRPFTVMVIAAEKGTPRAIEMFSQPPTPEQIRDVLIKAMEKPPRGTGKPKRPRAVAVTDDALFQVLPALIAERQLELEITRVQEPPELDWVVRQMELQMNEGREPLPGYLSVQGVTAAQVGAVFQAAADFYRAAPWIHWNNHQIIAVKHPREADYRYAIVMGMGGIEYGLAVARSWRGIEQLFLAEDDPQKTIPDGGYHSFAFDPMDRVPFDDLDAIEQYGWEIAGPDAYPFAFSMYKPDEIVRPSPLDLEWYEAALRVLPLLQQELKPDGNGDYAPFETTLQIPTHSGVVQVAVKYPGGELPRHAMPTVDAFWFPEQDDESDEDQPERDIEPLLLDRRAMERSLAGLGSMIGAERATHDESLQAAQDLMYDAWEERNPAKRLILAHDALALSADCADAWVLLAEEEADTLARAADYYQKGVEAGERALGDTFDDSVGHFWAILETRPYMRARAGLADTLWQLDRKTEALAHYNELLRLNPNDNQGIRDVLAGHLLELSRWTELGQLLDRYAEDWSAEWRYSTALYRFHVEGKSQQATRDLRQALKNNRFIPPYLLGKKRVPTRIPELMSMGEESEAIVYVAEHLNYWRREPGAVDWLREHVEHTRAAVAKPKLANKPGPARSSSSKSKRKPL